MAQKITSGFSGHDVFKPLKGFLKIGEAHTASPAFRTPSWNNWSTMVVLGRVGQKLTGDYGWPPAKWRLINGCILPTGWGLETLF